MDTLVSEQDKANTVRQIRLFMVLTPWWQDASDEVKGKRWSRTTLLLTQGRPVEERTDIWWRVMRDDPTSSVSGQEHQDVEDYQITELKDRISVFGDDGGLGALCGISPH